jgi:hypothetical protein
MVRESVAEILRDHVVFELESIDRMYCNLYVPRLQTGAGFAWFAREQLGAKLASTFVVAPLTERFVRAIESFVEQEGVDLVTFGKERKDDVAASYLDEFTADEGILFVGKAQEKARVFRTEKRVNPDGSKYPWVYPSTAMVNHYYFYVVDRDFGPLFVKFCSYFPYPAKICFNGHEWLKRQLAKRGITYEALDNGIASCEQPELVQRLANQLDEAKIDALVRKWLRRLPHPFSKAHRTAGYRYEVSLWQVEFALTQVFDRPLSGRCFFEEIIRENLDLGRPDHVQLLFDRRITRRTPGRFRTRILTEGVVPSLHVDYKSSRTKQYFKLHRALRTETTINNTYDFAIGRHLSNLSALRKIGFAANRRLLRAQSLSHDCHLGEDRLRCLTQPVARDRQKTSGLRFDDPRAFALMQALCLFSLAPRGFRHRDLRRHLIDLRAPDASPYESSQMTYDLRRLRLHGLIERIPKTHRYQLTEAGLVAAHFYVRFYARALRPAFSMASPGSCSNRSNQALAQLHQAIHRLLDQAQLAA